MCARQLHLSWKDHNGALVSVFDKLLERNSLVDCTLAAEGQYLKAHKVVLSACSSYFELLFNQESERNPIVILKDVKFEELKAAVTFMYRGEVEVFEDRLEAFLELSNSLKINGLGSEGAAPVSKQKDAAKDECSVSLFPCKRKASGNHGQSTEENPVVPINESSNSNNSSSQYVLPDRIDSSHMISSTSTYNFMPNKEKCSDQGNLESLLSTSEGVSEEDGSVLKMEPIVDAYQEHGDHDAESDSGDDICMIDGGDNWTEHNLKTVEDLPSEQDKNPPWNEEQRFSSITIKEEDPGPSTWEQANTNSMDAESGLSIGANGAVCSIPEDKEQSTAGTMQFCYPGGSDTWFASAISPTPSGNKGRPRKKRNAFQCSVKNHYCSLCCRAFTKMEMRTHMKFHDPSRRYKCPHCDYASKVSSHLRDHLFIHTGEKPYTCSLCGYATRQTQNLERHKRRNHSILESFNL